MNNNFEVKNNNKVLYETIFNAYNNETLSHAYLLSQTNKMTIDQEWKFLAQVLISQNPFTDKLRELENYADLHLIDGSKTLITKELMATNIENLQQTAIEDKGNKVLVIKNIDNANKQSLNSLLKFLEEPTDKTYIIMTTSKISQVLDTIKSRSQIIHLKNLSLTSQSLLLKNQNWPFPKVFAAIWSSFPQIENTKENKELPAKVVLFFQRAYQNKSRAVNDLFKLFTKENANILASIFVVFLNDIWRYQLNQETIFENLDIFKHYEKFNFTKALNALEAFGFQIVHNVNLSIALPTLVMEILDSF